MNTERYEQFLLESSLLHDSTVLAVEHANSLQEEYELMSEDEVLINGAELLFQMDYWQARLNLEERILITHMKKYREFMFDDEI